MSSDNDHNELEEYGEPGIASFDAPIPKWLKFNYVFWPIFGIIWFCMFWNGNMGWFDRGYWHELQKAANTTFPYYNADEMKSVETKEAPKRSKKVRKPSSPS